MPPQPAWLVGSKRGAEEPLAVGAKQLKFGEKGGQPKDGRKGKGKGKNRQQTDEHPGTDWFGQDEWQAGNDSWGWGWQEGGEWGPGEGEAEEEPRAAGGSGGGRRPQQGRDRPHRGAQADLNSAIISMHKLTLRSAADLRKAKHILEDFWLVPLNSPAVKAGIEGGKHYGSQVREKGRGHGLGPPHLTVALYFLRALHDQVQATNLSEGTEGDTAWAEITLRNFLVEAYNEVYGKTVGTETFMEFKVAEAYTGNKKDEGLITEEPIGGQAKVIIAFNHNPLLQVALAPLKDKIPEQKMKDFGAYQTSTLRMALGLLLHKIGGKKSDATGPKTQLERTVEANMRKLQGRARPVA